MLVTGSQPIRLVLDFAVAPSELEFDETLKSHRWHGGLHAFTAMRLVLHPDLIFGLAIRFSLSRSGPVKQSTLKPKLDEALAYC